MELVIVFGPPAVGKMTVGHELCGLTGFKLFHNHAAIEPILDIFPFGSPPFGRLVSEIRRRVIEEAAAAGLSGLVFTFVWGLEEADDAATVAEYAGIVEAQGGRMRLVELYADQPERVARNSTEFRLSRKASKRDLTRSHNGLLEMDRQYTMSTTPGVNTPATSLLDRHEHLRINNNDLSALEAAELIVEKLELKRL
jgi:hypothetical protein